MSLKEFSQEFEQQVRGIYRGNVSYNPNVLDTHIQNTRKLIADKNEDFISAIWGETNGSDMYNIVNDFLLECQTTNLDTMRNGSSIQPKSELFQTLKRETHKLRQQNLFNQFDQAEAMALVQEAFEKRKINSQNEMNKPAHERYDGSEVMLAAAEKAERLCKEQDPEFLHAVLQNFDEELDYLPRNQNANKAAAQNVVNSFFKECYNEYAHVSNEKGFTPGVNVFFQNTGDMLTSFKNSNDQPAPVSTPVVKKGWEESYKYHI